MQVTIQYNDEYSLTVEEVVRQAVHNYGKNVEVQTMPDSTKPHDLIYFGLQCIITHSQLGMLYNDKQDYHTNIQKLRKETLYKIEEILNQVIIDNEAKVA